MTTKLYTEAELEALRSMSKRVTNPGARWQEKPQVSGLNVRHDHPRLL